MDHHKLRDRLTNVFNSQLHSRSIFYFFIDVLIVSFWHVRSNILRFGRGKSNQSMHVLDAGSGFGQYSHFIARKYKKWNIFGADISKKEVSECNHFFQEMGYSRVYFKSEDLAKFVKADAFDLILAINVLEYIPNDQQVLENFYTSLKKDGQLIISVLSDRGKKAMPNFTNKLILNEEVLHRYNNLDLKKALKKMGFKNIHSQYSYGVSGKLSTILGVSLPKAMLKFSEYFLYIIPIYYLITYPIIFCLNFFDTYVKHLSGNEIVIRADK